MKRFLVIIVILGITGISFAQEKQWTLNECIPYAVKHSPRINNQNLRNSIYHQDYLEAIGRLLPSISANTTANFNFGRGLDGETNTYIDVNSFLNSYSLSASLTIFDGLANYTRVKIGRVSKMMGKERLEEEKDMVAYDTMETFFNVLYNQDVVKIAEQQLEESKKLFKFL